MATDFPDEPKLATGELHAHDDEHNTHALAPAHGDSHAVAVADVIAENSPHDKMLVLLAWFTLAALVFFMLTASSGPLKGGDAAAETPSGHSEPVPEHQ